MVPVTREAAAVSHPYIRPTMRSSISVRLSRAGFGLMAIWCLGCTSFDVLIEELLRGDAALAGCVMAGDGQTPSSADASSVRSQPVDEPSCGCDHCIAVQVGATEVAMAPHGTPDTLQQASGSALSIDREPHVPPPITAIAT